MGILLVTVVAASRVYLGAHYPLDVVAAAVYAACTFTLGAELVRTGPVRRVLAAVHLDSPDGAEPFDAPRVTTGPVPAGSHHGGRA